MTLPTQPDLSLASDREVVSHARAGLDDAFGELVRRYRDRVVAAALRIVRHPERAEDLAQETFVKAFGALDGYQSERHLEPWLLTIANNAANDYVRRARPDSPLSTMAYTPTRLDRDAARVGADESGEAPAVRAPADSRAQELQEALNGLRWDLRQCVILHHLEHRSHAEIARIMQVPVGTVKSRLARAREQLRAMVSVKRETDVSGSGFVKRER
jgi:RNA polymerase sigma-70 factor (ECF subfamily)